MKKFVYGLVLFGTIFGLQAVTDLDTRMPSQPLRELSKFESVVRDIEDFCFFELLGFQAVSSENELFIRHIIDGLAMNDYNIEIRRMSNLAQMFLGRANAFVVPYLILSSKFHSYLYIAEDWFDSLSEAEKEVLIRHELMHLKYNHAPKKLGFWIVISLINNSLKNMVHGKLDADSPVSYKIFDGTMGCAKLLAFYKFSRMIEKEADIEVFKTMPDKQAFISLFKNLEYHSEDPVSRFSIKRTLYHYYSFIAELFASHPPLDERIAYISELK